MGWGAYLAIALGGIVLMVACWLIFGRPRREGSAALAVALAGQQIKPLGHRHEWYVALAAEFINMGRRRIEVGAVQATVSGKGRPALEAKRILGEPMSQRRHAHAHPPDIALGLPIELLGRARLRYRFHLLFSSHIRQRWDSGILRFSATPVGGAPVEVASPLRPPRDATAA